VLAKDLRGVRACLDAGESPFAFDEQCRTAMACWLSVKSKARTHQLIGETIYQAAGAEAASQAGQLHPGSLLARVHQVYSMSIEDVRAALRQRGVPRYWQGDVRVLAEKLVTLMVLEEVESSSKQ